MAAAVALGGVLAHEGFSGGDVLRAMPPLTVPDRTPVPSGDVYLAARGGEDPNDPVVAVRTAAPLVALTFDDGPDIRWTPQILRILRRAGAHATFFAVGERVVAHPDLVRRALRWDNEVENHTWSHPIPLLALSPLALRLEIDRGRRTLRRVGAGDPRFFRPPHGAFDPAVTGTAARAGERTIGWDVPLDRFLHDRTPAQAAALAVDAIGQGSIILAHDSGRRRGDTVRVLPALLAGLRRRGLRVVTVGELLRSGSDTAPPTRASLPTPIPPRAVTRPAT